MKSSKSFLIFLVFFVFTIQLFPQTKLKKPSTKSPRIMIGAILAYNYVVGSANGNTNTFPLNRDEISGEYTFDPQNFGMQQGGGLTVWGKKSINKKRTLHATAEIGYNLFYNTRTKGLNRTKWSIFDLGVGVELSQKPTPRNRVFVGLQIQYSLIFGGWQTDITYPDNYTSNIYVKIDPASRVGLALNSGMEFRTSRKSTFVVGIRGIWANLLPKGTSSPLTGYFTSLHDSRGVTINSRKEIIYLQIFTGVNLNIRR